MCEQASLHYICYCVGGTKITRPAASSSLNRLYHGRLRRSQDRPGVCDSQATVL
ncbi:hypothetical protein HOLleu_25139 [Holothuria leucospilota]|uniref:Uncharacterized protein n=1 Tax=Holothuria leucospilota TaxID=206669 RepID=A0A9Q1H460_HOLLE|nr:hypothetical protein HOLleu_25139 [Holothuria leucospilota]